MTLRPIDSSLNSTGIALSPEVSEDYIQPCDYLRPLIGGAVAGLIEGTIVLLPGLIAAPRMFVPAVFIASFTSSMMFLVSALIHHQFWLYNLRKKGTDAFEVFHDLEMSKAEAFELCLAATTQLKNSHIEEMDEKRGLILVRVKGNFWVTVDRLVEISVHSMNENTVRVKVASIIRLTKVRTYLIEKAWGQKWRPIIFRTDAGKNRKIMDALLVYIQSIPNWDHKHLPGVDHNDPSVLEPCA